MFRRDGTSSENVAYAGYRWWEIFVWGRGGDKGAWFPEKVQREGVW